MHHLLVLLVDEPGHLPQTLLVVGLSAEVDDVGGQAGHATLAVRGAAPLLSLGVETVEGVDGVLVQLLVDLPLQLCGEPGGEPDSCALGEVSLNKHFPAVCLRQCCCCGVVGHPRLEHHSII